MEPRSRNWLLGCLAIGCLGTIALVSLLPTAAGYWAVGQLRAGPTLAPVFIPTPAPDDKSCSTAAVEAYVQAGNATLPDVLRAAQLSVPAEDGKAPDRPLGAAEFDRVAIRDLDLVALRRSRDTYAATQIPACLEGIRRVELEMVDALLAVAEEAKASTDGNAVIFGRLVLGMGRVARRYPEALDRAWQDLGNVYDIDVQSIRQRYSKALDPRLMPSDGAAEHDADAGTPQAP